MSCINPVVSRLAGINSALPLYGFTLPINFLKSPSSSVVHHSLCISPVNFIPPPFHLDPNGLTNCHHSSGSQFRSPLLNNFQARQAKLVSFINPQSQFFSWTRSDQFKLPFPMLGLLPTDSVDVSSSIQSDQSIQPHYYAVQFNQANQHTSTADSTSSASITQNTNNSLPPKNTILSHQAIHDSKFSLSQNLEKFSGAKLSLPFISESTEESPFFQSFSQPFSLSRLHPSRFFRPIIGSVPVLCLHRSEFTPPPKEFVEEAAKFRPQVEKEESPSVVPVPSEYSRMFRRRTGNLSDRGVRPTTGGPPGASSNKPNAGQDEPKSTTESSTTERSTTEGSNTEGSIQPRSAQPKSTAESSSETGQPSPSSSPTATNASSKVYLPPSDVNVDGFPFTLPPNASVRMYCSQQQPWWKVVIAGGAVVVYMIVWVISALFPLYFVYWSWSQATQFYHYHMGLELSAKLPPLLQFCDKLKEAVRDTLIFAARTIKATPSFLFSMKLSDLTKLSTHFMSQYRTAVNRFLGVVYCLGWKDLGTISYLFSIFLVNAMDYLRPPSQIPHFVKTTEDARTLGFARKWKLALNALTFNWFRPGTAVIFEDYRAFVLSGRFSNPPTLISYGPHGVISLGMFFLFSLPEMDGYKVMGAPVLKYFCPLFRLLASGGYVQFGSCDRDSFLQAMQNQESLILVPGGLPEATLSDYGKERVYIKDRKGFVRYSLQNGYSITPVYGFGENLSYKQLLPDVLPDTKLWLNSKGIPTVYPFSWLCWPVGFLPFRNPLLVVVGHPVKLPKIERPTAEDVEYYHNLYMSEIHRLYATYADSYYRYCKNKYKIELPKPSPNDISKAIALLSEAPPLQFW